MTFLGIPGIDIVEAYELLMPLIIFLIGVVIYSIFIFKMYRFIARKDVIKLDLQKHAKSEFAWLKKIISVIFYVVEYIILFPIFIFFWFAVLVLLLSFLAKNQQFDTILTISMSVVAAIRVTAYYHEDLSRDLAKMLPFALLGIFLVDVGYFSYETAWSIIQQAPDHLPAIIYYLAFTIILEFLLRIIHSIVLIIRPETAKEEDEEDE